MFSSAVVAVTPSRMFSSVAVAVTATSSLIFGDVKVLFVSVSDPASVAKSASVSAVLNSASVPDTVFDPSVIDLLENVFVDDAETVISVVSATVPVASGSVIVLSAVGSAVTRLVSKSSTVVPSNLISFLTSRTVLLIIVVVPLTVKSPDTVTFPLPSAKTTVPVASGNVIVRSTVGSVMAKVVSKSSAVEPSKVMLEPNAGFPGALASTK